jgi:hypothetical protein
MDLLIYLRIWHAYVFYFTLYLIDLFIFWSIYLRIRTDFLYVLDVCVRAYLYISYFTPFFDLYSKYVLCAESFVYAFDGFVRIWHVYYCILYFILPCIWLTCLFFYLFIYVFIHIFCTFLMRVYARICIFLILLVSLICVSNTYCLLSHSSTYLMDLLFIYVFDMFITMLYILFYLVFDWLLYFFIYLSTYSYIFSVGVCMHVFVFLLFYSFLWFV